MQLTALLPMLVFAASPLSVPQDASRLRGMAVSPLMFRNQVAGGTQVKLPIDIQNLQIRPSAVHVKVSPVVYEDWTYIAKLGEDNPHDCSRWFHDVDMNVRVPGSTTQTCNLVASIPHVRPGVYWCLATVDPRFDGDNSTITAQYQVPIILFVGHQPRPGLKLGTPEMAGTPAAVQVRVPFVNDGEGFTVVGANVELRQAATGRVIATFIDNDRNLYPGTKRYLTYGAGALPAGEYAVISKPQAGTRSFGKLSAKFVVTKTEVKEATASSVLEMAPVVVEPPALKLTMPAGGQRSAVVRVTNASQKQVTVSVTPTSILQTSSGAFELGQTPPANGLSVTTDPSSLTLEPGQATSVRVVVAGDQTAKGDQWFGISAKTPDVGSVAEEVYGSVSFPGGSPKLEVIPGVLKKTNGYPMSLQFQVRNSGTMALKPIGFAQVLESGLAPIATLQVPKLGDGGILPGSVLSNEVMLPLNLQPGVYTVNVKYQYGQDLFAEVAVPVSIGHPVASKKVKTNHR